MAAPAGFGKTTLLAEWLASPSFEFEVLSAKFTTANQTQHSKLRTQNYRAAWLALDHDDNDPARFWSYLVGALGQMFPNMPEQAHAPQLLAAPSGQTYLINTIAATPHRRRVDPCREASSVHV